MSDVDNRADSQPGRQKSKRDNEYWRYKLGAEEYDVCREKAPNALSRGSAGIPSRQEAGAAVAAGKSCSNPVRLTPDVAGRVVTSRWQRRRFLRREIPVTV